MLRKLLPLLLLTGCFQQGLVATEKEPTESGLNTGGSTGDDEPLPLTVHIKTERKAGAPFAFTRFADHATYDPSTHIKGYGNNNTVTGSTVCLSNESTISDGTFEGITQCRRPLWDDLMPDEEHELARNFEELPDISSPSPSKAAFILQGLQLYFSNTLNPATNAPTDFFSSIDLANLKITLKTAPLQFKSETGYFNWDSANVSKFTYNPSHLSECNLTANGSVGFDLSNDRNLSNSERNKYFITGLWIFERSPTIPYEDTNVSPVGAQGPQNLFSSRSTVLGSFILPEMGEDENGALSYKFFPGYNPGNANSNAPSSEAAPYKFSFGLKRNESHLGDVSTENEESQSASQNFNGAYVTPMMGKYDKGSTVSDWNNRVIIGLCIQGTRTNYNGKTTYTGTNDPKTYPLVHALKYEARKIKIYTK